MWKRLAALSAVAAISACSSPDPDPVTRSSEAEVQALGIPRAAPPYVLGQAAPDFHLPVMNGYVFSLLDSDSIRLSDQRGKVVVLNFWYTECSPCAAEHETLNRVARKFEARGVRYFGVNDVDTPATLGAFEATHGATAYPNLFDEGAKIGKLYGRTGWPLHVVIDREGHVAWWRRGGPIEEALLTGVIEDVLSGRRPTAFTAAEYPDDPGS